MIAHRAIVRVALISSLFLVACADKEYIAKAEKSVRLLHDELKQPNFDAVWLKAASEFQRTIERKESNAALASIPESVRKAPRVQSDRPRLRYFTDILYVQLYYQIEVGQGDKYEETVTYKLDHGFATLARYELSGSGIQVILDGPMQCRQPSRRALSVILLPAPGERTHCPDFRSGA
jgi:hypothetical protein